MPYVVVALIVVPIIEIYLMLQVGHAIGALPTIALLILISLLGAWLIRREGARAWTAFTGAVGSGRLPGREVADGALIMLGGALLLTPGFLSDVLGVLCLLPPTRALLRRPLLGYVMRRAAGGRSRWVPPVTRVRAERADSPGQTGRHPVIDGDVLPPRQEPPTT